MTGKTSKFIVQVVEEGLLSDSIKIDETSKLCCNNWRKRNKLPTRRKGSSIKIFKLSFEHYTTKKQKRRWKKKHLFKPII